MAYFNGRWNAFIFVDAGPKGNAVMLTQENNKKDEEVKLIGSGSHCFIESEETSRRIHSLLYGEHLSVWRKVHNLNG